MTLTRFVPALTLWAALAMPLAAWAQETTADPAAPAPDAAAPAVSTENQLPLGQEVPDQGIGSTYSAATFEAWDQRCAKSGTDVDPCQLYQLLKDQAGTSVAEITIFGLPEEAAGEAVAGATFIAPLETLLTSGLQLQVDAGKPKAYPFAFCAQLGCVVRLGFTQAEIDAMKKGNELTAVIVPFVAQDEKVILKVSLKGFTAGYDAVNAANAKADAAAKAAEPAPAASP
jgi:invasion protein IalB